MPENCHSILRDSQGRRLCDVASVSCDFEDGKVLPEHFHPEDQLAFASRGVMIVSTSQGFWVVPPLRAVWIPAFTPHSIVMSGAVSMRTLYFLPKRGGISRKCSVMNVSPLLRELILHACNFQRLRKRKPSQRRLIEMILEQVRAVPSVPLQLPQPVDTRALRVARELLTDPGDRRTLEALCRQSGASRRTMERLFIEETKMTFSRWRQQVRLLHAVKLLAGGEKVTAAALESGYHSASAFIAMFRNQLGSTPARYFESGRGSYDGTSHRGIS